MAQPGTRDGSFGNVGIWSHQWEDGSRCFGSLVEPNGDIIVVGSVTLSGSNFNAAIARVLVDGELDEDFNGMGIFMPPAPSFNPAQEFSATARQVDGKIVCVGRKLGEAQQIIATRNNANGTADITFGVDGIMHIDIGGDYPIAEDVAILPNGKILVAAQRYNGTTRDWVLLRLNDNGQPDATFGSQGLIVTEVAEEGAVPKKIMLQPDGKILLAGGSRFNDVGNNYHFALVRYDANGALDPEFGSGGRVITPIGDNASPIAGVALLPNGSIIASGTVREGDDVGFAVVKYEPNGQLSSLFGEDGMVLTFHLDSGIPLAGNAGVVVDADGRIIIGGTSGDYLALARYQSNGTLDVSFGMQGIARLSPYDEDWWSGTSISLQPDQRIIMGATGFRSGAGYLMHVVRIISGLNLHVNDLIAGAQQFLVYPNPLPQFTTLQFELDRSSAISISLNDEQGRLVRVFATERLTGAGLHQERLDLSGIANGRYLIRVEANEREANIVVVKG